MFEVDDFARNGAFVIPQFASSDEIQSMKDAMASLIDNWDPNKSKNSVFTTNEDQHIRSMYFLDSSENVSFFLEAGAVETGTGDIRSDLPKNELINKVGHALHLRVPAFKDYCHSPKVAEVLQRVGYVDPVLPQTMYIFKQPRIGGTVTSHQDSTFLHTEPRQTCLGLWLALDDANLNNGCLWFRPGSHTEPLRRRFVKNSNYDTDPTQAPTEFIPAQPDDTKWEGTLPGNTPAELEATGFVPVPVQAGDLVGIHGLVDHLSLANTSDMQRHSFQMHLIDRHDSTWSRDNWLQYKDGREFAYLYGA